jgi:hypothetical protein
MAVGIAPEEAAQRLNSRKGGGRAYAFQIANKGSNEWHTLKAYPLALSDLSKLQSH